jgi:hypothetical protein
MAKTYEPIATQTADGSTGVIEFTSIPSTYTDLILVSNLFSPDTGHGALVSLIGVGNGTIDTGSNYSYTYTTGNGSTASSSRLANGTVFAAVFASTAQSGNTAWSNSIIQFQNYSNTTTYKSMLWRDNVNGDGSATWFGVGLWRSTSVINRIKLTLNVSQVYASGSTFTLYGIKAA